jgi:diacylglycerol kinase family enzyme
VISVAQGLPLPVSSPTPITPAAASGGVVRPQERVLAVVSPASGSQSIDQIVSLLCDWLHEGDLACEFIVAPGGPSLRLSLNEALDEGYRRIFIAAGGAGLRHALNVVAGRETEAVVLPVDGNQEFSNWLGLPSDLFTAALQCWTWSARPVDLVSVRVSNGAKELMWGIAQAGPAVEAGWLSADRPTSSTLLAMLSASHFTVPSFELDTGDERITGRLLHFAAAGPAARLLVHSNGAAPADTPKPVEAVLAGLLPASQLFQAISAILESGGFRWPLERQVSAKRLRLVTDPPIPFYIDSEAVGSTPIEIEMAPAAVRLILPYPASSVESNGAHKNP